MEAFFFDISIVLVGSAILSFCAILLKQPILLGYILCGVLVGPWGFKGIHNAEFIEVISHLGITLLLFLAGLCLHPQKLIQLFRKTTVVIAGNCLVSLSVVFLFVYSLQFSLLDSLLIGLAMMFSSTILVVKLLPTTALHHQPMGATCIGVLIFQDLIAIAVLAFLRCIGHPDGAIWSFTLLSLRVVGFILVLIAFEYYILRKIMGLVERFHEALFILGLAWCFGVASISNHMGLFYETGAFFAGVVLARHSIARFIFIELKPIRDFFLVLFFFTLGARLDLWGVRQLLIPALVLTGILILGRPWVFQQLFRAVGEKKMFSKEVGIRLGQSSEFGLLIAMLGLELGHLSHQGAVFIQVVTIFTFIASSYIVFHRYPTPIGVPGKLMKD